MRKTLILLLTLLILLVIALALLILGLSGSLKNITGASVGIYSHTKAICDDKNYCQDYEIVCNRSNLISMNPITGAVLQNSKDWKDPRDEEEINSFCS